MVEELLEALRARGWTVTAAESCTGGMVAAAITDVAGSSDVFERGFVTYSNGAKEEMLGVRAETLDAHGAVSEPVAREMAEGALRAARAELSIAISGIAGPGGSEHKPEGRVCFALAAKGDISSETVEFGALGRRQVREAARDHALRRLLEALS
ncbi:MAG: CinA family protein [Pseudomonadota bacterium]